MTCKCDRYMTVTAFVSQTDSWLHPPPGLTSDLSGLPPLPAPPYTSQLSRFCQIQVRGWGCFKMTST